MSLLSVDIADYLSPRLRIAAQNLHGTARLKAHQAMGEEVQAITLVHLRMIAATRHSTAQRLGASPSNFVAQAVDAAGEASVVRPDADGVSISIRHPVVSRAFRDIRILPKNAAGVLTIPIHRLAYNRRAAQFPGIFRLGGRGSDVGKNILAIKDGDSVIPLFLLVKSVLQRQDRTLMPSTENIGSAAARGLTSYIRMTLQAAKLN